MEKLSQLSELELAHVEGFSVSRAGFGSVKWFGRVDVRGLIIHEVVEISELSVEVYKDGKDTPPRGSGLNRPALLTIEKLKVPSYFDGPPGTFSETLRDLNKEQDAEFVDYDEESAVWTFKVKHFTKYAFMPAAAPPTPLSTNLPDATDKQEGGAIEATDKSQEAANE
jgi:nuclear pore complex protein Nup98-Nup96